MNPSRVTTPCLRRLGLAGRKRKSLILGQISNWSRKKLEISTWLEAHRNEIHSGSLVVLFEGWSGESSDPTTPDSNS